MTGNLNEAQTALLWDAVEGTFLMEIRNGGHAPESDELLAYRRDLASSLIGLVERGLVVARLSSWGGASGTEVEVSIDQLRSKLDDGSVWNPDLPENIVIDATDAGRKLAGATPLD